MEIFKEDIKDLSEHLNALQDDIERLNERVGHAINASNYPDCEDELHELRTTLSDIADWVLDSCDAISFIERKM